MTTLSDGLSRVSWQSNLRAVLAIARKDWRQYWRYPLNVLSTVVQPLIWLAPVYFMASAFSVNGKAVGFAGYTGTTDYVSFAILGTALGGFIDTVFWGMGYALKNDMDSGVLESNWLAPLSRPLLLAGRTLTSLATTAINSTAVLVLAALLFGFRANGNILGAVLTAVPMILGLYGFGFAFAALVLIMRDANMLVDMGSFLVNGLSGVQFPVNSLPRWLLPVSLAIPLTYGFDAVRGWLLGTRTLLPIPVEIGLLVVVMFVTTFIGLAAFRVLERRVRIKGTLGQY